MSSFTEPPPWTIRSSSRWTTSSAIPTRACLDTGADARHRHGSLPERVLAVSRGDCLPGGIVNREVIGRPGFQKKLARYR